MCVEESHSSLQKGQHGRLRKQPASQPHLQLLKGGPKSLDIISKHREKKGVTRNSQCGLIKSKIILNQSDSLVQWHD